MTERIKTSFEKCVDKVCEKKAKEIKVRNFYKQTLGHHLRQARVMHEMSVDEMSAKLGISRIQLHNLEYAKSNFTVDRFFMCIQYLFGKNTQRRAEFLEAAFEKLEKAHVFFEKVAYQKKIDKIAVKECVKIAKARAKLRDEILRLDIKELRKIIQFVNLFGKNKQLSSPQRQP